MRHGRSGPDRWLVSYADLVTLLMAFFTAMYALAAADASHASVAAAALRRAFESGSVPAPDRLGPVRAHVTGELRDAIAGGRVAVVDDSRGLVLSLPEGATFALGSADVTDEARGLLGRLASVLRTVPNEVRVEGHTDDGPISTPRFSSNWELSTARASAVVALFIARGLDPRRLSAAGYGQFHPTAPNTSPAGRAANRRVDVVIVPDASVPGLAGGKGPHD